MDYVGSNIDPFNNPFNGVRVISRDNATVNASDVDQDSTYYAFRPQPSDNNISYRDDTILVQVKFKESEGISLLLLFIMLGGLFVLLHIVVTLAVIKIHRNTAIQFNVSTEAGVTRDSDSLDFV